MEMNKDYDGGRLSASKGNHGVAEVFLVKKWGILIKMEFESLIFTGLEIPRDYLYETGYTLRKINWVIPGGRSKRMFLMLGCVLWILMLLCSCGRNLPDSEQVIKRYLKEKYNQEFQIVHTERKNIGQNFGEFINTGEAVSLNESDDAFSFTIYEDGRITDNYPKVILGNQIKQDIYSILDHGKLEYTNVDIRFIESDQVYATFEDYKSNHNVLIFSDLKGLETNVDKDIENAYDLLCVLRDQGYYFCLTIDIDKASKTIIYDQDNEMISKDSFIQKFS